MTKADMVKTFSNLLALARRGRYDVNVKGAEQIAQIISIAQTATETLAQEAQDEGNSDESE